MSDVRAPTRYVDPRLRPGRVSGTILNVSLLIFLLSASHNVLSSAETTTVVLGLGLIGVWRHSWGLLNIVRALMYQSRAPDNSGLTVSSNCGLVVLVTVYNQTDEDVKAVALALRQSVKDLPFRTLVVFTHLTETQKLIMEDAASPNMSVHYVLQRGLGKREALADGLSIARRIIPKSAFQRFSVLLIDGDTLLTPQAVTESLITLGRMPSIGAVVVNEFPLLKGTTLFGAWRLLRSLQRNKLMSSFALSDRTLVLTGRFAMVRADILLQIDVINRIRKDYLRTDKFNIPLLTGDDKTTWLEVLRRGYGMTYLPNAYIYPIESPNMEKGFLRGIISLTSRYSGNMARANLHLDAWKGARGKWHFRYGLLDQRISMWTSLLTPAVLLILIISGQLGYFVVFLTYVVLIKNMQAIGVSLLGGHYDPLFPYLIFLDQIVQSSVKVVSFAYLHKQSWTNQGIRLASGADSTSLDATSRRILSLRVAFFVIFLGYLYFFLRNL